MVRAPWATGVLVALGASSCVDLAYPPKLGSSADGGSPEDGAQQSDDGASERGQTDVGATGAPEAGADRAPDLGGDVATGAVPDSPVDTRRSDPDGAVEAAA